MATRENWAPAVDAVGALLRARTKDRAGNEVGTFNADTRPTGEEVEALIDQAQEDIVAVLGTEDVPERWQLTARSVTVLGTALLVEIGYFPEQVNTGRSPYPQIKELYDDRLKRLVTGVAESIVVPGDEDMSGLEQLPVWTGLANVPHGEFATWNPITQVWERRQDLAAPAWRSW